MYSAVLILSASLKEKGDQIGSVMGWGPESYTIPLSSDLLTVTHYGLRTDVSKQFVDWILTKENLPDIPDLELVLDNLIYDFAGIDHNLWGREHLDYVCSKYNLSFLE